MASNLNYLIESGEFGEVVILDSKMNRIAARLKKTVLRSFGLEENRKMVDWMGSAWQWLGIEVSRLPVGVNSDDLAQLYSIARDEMMDAA